MGLFGSIWRFVSTLGGIVGSKVDQATEGMLTTPAGIKATFGQARGEWPKQYKEVREAVSQLVMLIEEKDQEIAKLNKEHEDVTTKMNGAIEKYKETDEDKYREAFTSAHERQKELETRMATLETEKAALEDKVTGYKDRLTEMQRQIQDLDGKEAEAIADIVSSQQIISLNDRLSNMATTLKDKNLQAVSRKQAQLKAQAKLSSELAGTDSATMDRELMKAGQKTKSDDLFQQMLDDSNTKAEAKKEAMEKPRQM
ncbi:MAG: hypothetical protein HRU15_19720 [Planctomycetes bacterium]|nr:hypothetical protein [Planctomycetota bacterium]